MTVSPFLQSCSRTELLSCIDGSGQKEGLAAGEAVQQALQRGDDQFFVEAVVHLAALLAGTHQASPSQQVQVVRNSWTAQRHTLGNLADVQLGACQQLHQVLTHRVGQCDEQVATDGQVL